MTVFNQLELFGSKGSAHFKVEFGAATTTLFFFRYFS